MIIYIAGLGAATETLKDDVHELAAARDVDRDHDPTEEVEAVIGEIEVIREADERDLVDEKLTIVEEATVEVRCLEGAQVPDLNGVQGLDEVRLRKPGVEVQVQKSASPGKRPGVEAL